MIGGAVVKAARRSAGASRLTLARRLEVDTATVRAWENGVVPLFEVPLTQLRQLADALRGAGAQVGCDLGDLLLASQCDLLITGMLHDFEDYAEVPPIDEEGPAAERARGLLRWALTGHAPAAYSHYAAPGRLLGQADVGRLNGVASGLEAGAHGDDLTGYGAALVALICA